VPTGRAVIFTGARLDASAVLASACLPQLFKAVEIDGEAYWDGGYSANPALTPLIQSCASADLMLVQINPLRVADTPQTAADIADRVNELTFNASLLTQMRTIEYINALIAQGSLRGPAVRTVRMHRVDGGEAIRSFPSSSRTSADAAMIDALFRTGQHAASHWLERHYDALGQHSTVDIRRDYLDDTRITTPRPAVAAAPRGFRPWLAQLLRRRRQPK
jgi:NTE family protein